MINQDFHYNSSNLISYSHKFSPSSKKQHPSYISESHSMVEIMLVVQGKIYYTSDGAQYAANKGDIAVINAGEFHTSRASHVTLCERLILHFSTNYIPVLKSVSPMNAFQKASLYQHIIPKEIVQKTKIPSLLKKIEAVCKSEDRYKDLKLFSLIVSFVAEFNIAVDLLTSKNHYISSPTITNDLFRSAIDYINENIQKPLPISAVAQYIGLSESYLHRLFKKNMGITILNYIQNQKMQLALSLLRKGHSAQTVSEMVGYEYYATFSNSFKKIFGKSPNQFK